MLCWFLLCGEIHSKLLGTSCAVHGLQPHCGRNAFVTLILIAQFPLTMSISAPFTCRRAISGAVVLFHGMHTLLKSIAQLIQLQVPSHCSKILGNLVRTHKRSICLGPCDMMARQVVRQDKHVSQHVVAVKWQDPQHMSPSCSQTELPNCFHNAEDLSGRTLTSWHCRLHLWVSTDNYLAWYELPTANHSLVIRGRVVRPPIHDAIRSIRWLLQTLKKPLEFPPRTLFGTSCSQAVMRRLISGTNAKKKQRLAATAGLYCPPWPQGWSQLHRIVPTSRT